MRAVRMRGRTRNGSPVMFSVTTAVMATVLSVTMVGCAGDGRLDASNGDGDSATDTELPVLVDATTEAHATDVATTGEGDDGDGDDSKEWKSDLARMLAAGEIRSVRLVGDSLTAGYGCDGYDEDATTGRLIYDGPEGTYYETPGDVACWANEFRRYAEEHGVTDFLNAGVSGSKMWWLADSPRSWLGDGADAIVVMLGTNDAVYSTEGEFRADAEAALSEAAGMCRCLVVMSPPSNDRTDASNRYGMEVIDSVLRGVCDEHGWCFVSLVGELDGEAGDLNDDRCHPTTQGSMRIWEAMRRELGLPNGS